MSNHHGKKKKTRRKFSKPSGKITTVNELVKPFNVGDRAVVKVNPSVPKGQPFRRFHGKNGTIVGKQGAAYYVSVRFGNSIKKTIALPAHLKPLKA